MAAEATKITLFLVSLEVPLGPLFIPKGNHPVLEPLPEKVTFAIFKPQIIHSTKTGKRIKEVMKKLKKTPLETAVYIPLIIQVTYLLSNMYKFIYLPFYPLFYRIFLNFWVSYILNWNKQ